MPPATCPHCREPYPDTAPECPACGRPTSSAGRGHEARGWWSIRLKAPFWAVVSILLLFCGFVVVGGDDAKGRAALVAVGAFGLLCSLAVMAHARIRARRDPS